MPDYVFFRGGVELAALTVEGSDFPIYFGTFSPTADFEDARLLFEQLDACVHGGEGNFDEIWNKIIQPGVYLQSLHDGERIDDFI